MKVTLAWPHGDHEPGATVDLPDAEAKTLLRDGFARLADTPQPGPKAKTTTKEADHGR